MNFNRLTFVFVLLSFLYACCPSFAQNNHFQFSQLDRSGGLSHNQVNCIYKDSKGFMWFGTMAGLNRYDGYTIKVFKHIPGDGNSINDDFIQGIFEGPEQNLWIVTGNGLCIYNFATEQFNSDLSPWLKLLKLPGTNITKIKKDSKGNFWFIYPDSGIYRYDPFKKQTYHYSHDKGVNPVLFSNNITDLTEDAKGNMWFVYDTGIIEKMNATHDKIIYRNNDLSKLNNDKSLFYCMLADRDGDLWLYASGINLGVYYVNPKKNSLTHIDKTSAGAKLNANTINGIYQADDGVIWIGTDHGGINLINKKNFTVSYLLNREDDSKSLRQNSVVIYKDNLGIMWAGTFKEGISYYHKNIIKFPLYRHFASDPKSLSFDDVDSFVEDKKGNLWIATNGDGLIYFNRNTGQYTQFKNNPQNSNSLSNDIIVSLCIDHNQTLWIGTYFGGMDSFDGKTFHHYRHDDKVKTSIADDRVWSIVQYDPNHLLVGTFAGGVGIFDLSKKTFSYPYNLTQIRSPLVTSIFLDKDSNIWVGGYAGVDVVMKNGRIIHYIHDDNNVHSLISNHVNSIMQDSRGLIWIATRAGLSILNLKNNRFTSLIKQNGLPDNVIQNILEDNSGKMWLSTSNGLCRITLNISPKGYNFQFENFDETDGLQGREFNVNAAFKTSKGELLFGGGHGFNLFDPLSIKPNTNKPKLIFTGFQLFNKDIAANEGINGHVILSKAISETTSITLNHSENVFTIEFAALDFFNPNKVKYQYMLDGFDKSWITIGNGIRKATYTNLDGGEYTFKVRATNMDALWNTDSIALKIKVRPPFWKSPLAYIIYLFIIVGTLLLIRQRGIQKIRREFVVEQEKKEVALIIEQERKEVERMYEIDRLKTKFLTNVSHEFRTPLSLIMAPVDKMLSHNVDADQKQQLNMIRKNARRLLNLVNQLLDFRKMEVQELKLHTRPGDIVKFINEVSLSFTDIAEEKGIGFVFDTTVESLRTSFDHDKVERILFNLLSNAFKFTPKGGYISVLLSLIPERAETNLEYLEIKVMDTGIGIPNDKKQRIFDRFFQNDLPGSILNQGSGIGLAITKEFVNMHQGEIFVESDTVYGSCFIVQLPMMLTNENDGEINVDNEPVEEMGSPSVEIAAKDSIKINDKQTVLLVEDNDDFRFYLKDNLKGMFHIIEATNGKEGWQKALALHPDIMVSDISMPEMNGKDLCRKIKNDSRTSHIPVILVTALIGEEEELKSLEIGANDYITKPFNFEILISKIKNLLSLQATFKKTYARQLDFQSNEPAIPSADEKFIKDIIEHINKNMLNPALSVNELSKHMGMNRNTLYKKLLMITGNSPVEYIRSLRLKKAAHLLEHSQMNISEVSFEVGFNTPHYFAKSFKDAYNMLPSEFVVQKRKPHHQQTDIS